MQDKFALFSQEAQQALTYLPKTVRTLVKNLSHVDKDIAAALRLESADNQRLAFTAIEERLEELVNELLWNQDSTIKQLKPLIMDCREVLSLYKRQIAHTIELQQEINNPYITGIPLDETQEIFVGRAEF
ncbi:MAG: hypothetical protein BWK79_18485, partial [Beggiatoa sp. IS2]